MLFENLFGLCEGVVLESGNVEFFDQDPESRKVLVFLSNHRLDVLNGRLIECDSPTALLTKESAFRNLYRSGKKD